MPKHDDRQLELPLTAEPAQRPKLKLISGLGQKKVEPLGSRDAVARVLMEAGADLLLRRISSDRAEFIEKAVDEILTLFDRVDHSPILMPVLQRKLDDLEALMRETRDTRSRTSQVRRRR